MNISVIGGFKSGYRLPNGRRLDYREGYHPSEFHPTYMIKVRDQDGRAMPLDIIAERVERFVEFARSNPDLTFDVTLIACCADMYDPEDIAPMFSRRSSNVNLCAEFSVVINRETGHRRRMKM